MKIAFLLTIYRIIRLVQRRRKKTESCVGLFLGNADSARRARVFADMKLEKKIPV